MKRFRRLLYKLVAGAARAFNRNPWTSVTLELVPRIAYQHDGLSTVHNHSFLDDPSFQRAYHRAVRAAGWDYEIYWRIHVILWAARSVEHLPGAFVECGTGRGFAASAICECLRWGNRPFYLFDTFEPGRVTPDSTLRHETRCAVYADGPDAVRENFREWRGVQLVVGRVPESLGQVSANPVAFLHVDMNHPSPEEAALRHFWPRMSPGGMVVFDDYAYRGFELSHDSADRVAADLGFSILSLPTGQGLAVKPPPNGP